ncbi:hypothetical protein [Halobaculum rubrum]|uniref:hypothetical protein n=1 Tax=Halobaculum rubrum TaxID=2872158 RepID=UPI001CA3B801|nr:hypothetical protein [Halobaculum rubrum]QZX98709.1 hypothetical protein K6T25_10525 [Halobaculum rubrum]
MTLGERLPHEPEEVVCLGCGRYVLTRETERIDVSREDEYYPEIRHLCPDCQGPDEADTDRGEGVATDGGKGATVVTLTDEQIEALANRELAIVKTDDNVFGLIHENRADEALDAVSTLAAARGAEFDVKEVTERA